MKKKCFLLLATTAKIRLYRFRSPAQAPEQTRLESTPIFYCNMPFVSCAKFNAFITVCTIITLTYLTTLL